MQHYLLPKKRQQVDGPINTCGASEKDSGDCDGENADTTSAGPQPQEGTTHTQDEKLPPGPKDLSQLPDSGPTCPDLKRYPVTEYSSQSRSFKKNWHDHHSWLEYSVAQDAAFCFACRLFSHIHFTYQNEAKRGHREGSQSNNRGNFLELLDMISRYDEIMKKKLSGPGNAKYTHHDIQNELLDIIVGMIGKNISKEVMKAEHFALIVDETKDVSKQEQLFIVAAEEFFVTIQKLHKFFSTLVVHEEFLKVQKLEPVNQHIKLKRLSETRWACQHAACLAVERTLSAILTTLKRLVERDNVHRAPESKGLCILLDQQFVISLVAIEKLLLMTKQLSDHLQSPNLQLASAEDLVQFVVSGFSEMRTEASWIELEESAEDICKEVRIHTETLYS
ncbi:uncharacterized protein LOC143232282 [Tachypleus tridentatus]|uniref:uncharacterized protein LOC143232282 n=1 Tax=Tachypleus tridentatus TaxID=6853 RepID=UPI003FD1B18F